jgi:hypothetical protein
MDTKGEHEYCSGGMVHTLLDYYLGFTRFSLERLGRRERRFLIVNICSPNVHCESRVCNQEHVIKRLSLSLSNIQGSPGRTEFSNTVIKADPLVVFICLESITISVLK